MKVLKCPICGRVREAARRRRSCSQTCAARLLWQTQDRAQYRANRVAAGAQARATYAKRRYTKWAALFPAVPIDVLTQVYRSAYNSGRTTARRTYYNRGFEEGYEAAMQDQRRSA